MRLVQCALAAALAVTAAAQSQDSARYPQTGTFYSYIQSSGAQHVNTRYCTLEGDAIDCWIDLAKNQPNVNNPYPTVFGAAFNNKNNAYILQARTPSGAGGNGKSCFRRSANNYFDNTIPAEQVAHIVCKGLSAQWFKEDGTLGGSAATSGSLPGDSLIPLLIFQCNYADTEGGVRTSDNWWCNMKLYGFTITSGEKVVRDFKPYRAADGQVGLWDVAENDDPDYERFYPNAGSSAAPFVAAGVSYALLPDGETVRLYAGTLDIVTPRGVATVEKSGEGTVHAEAVTTYTNLKLTEGVLSFADGSAQTVSAEKLILSGGAILDVDLMDGGCDAFQAGSVDLSAASAANPVRVRVAADPSREGTFMLIDAGLSDGDEAKFASADLSVPLTFAVKDGALEMTLSKYVPVVKATWTNAKGDGNIADPGNWLCLDGADRPIDDVLPTRETDVRLSGECVFSCPVGSTFQCRSLALDGVSLTGDCDWRGLPVPFEGTVDVKGRRLDVSSFDGAATVTDSVGGGELHANIPSGVQASTASVTLTGKLKLVKDGLGALAASKTGQTYSGGTEIVAGTFACGGPGVDRGYGAAGSTVTVRSGACFNLDGYSNHYEYTIVLDGGTLTSTTERGNMSHAWLKHVVLTADSVLSTASCLGLVANGYSDTTIELGGHTLAVQCIGTNPADVHFYMCNLTVSGGGTLRFTGGGLLRLGNNFKTNGGSDGMYVHGADVTLDIRDMGIDCTQGDVSFANYISSYSGALDSGAGPIKVSIRFKPGAMWHATQLGNGATIDFSGTSGTLDGAKLSYATDAARINVDFGSRVPRSGTKIISWTAGTKPAAKVKFKSASCGLRVKDDGLYVHTGMALMIY